MLEGLLHHKKEIKDYICALVVSGDRIDAALWEAEKDARIQVLKTANQAYNADIVDDAGWEQAIDAADKAITEIETALPQGVELTKVVFGLFPEWLAEDHIKEVYLKKLKQLTLALSLTPVGFVELPTALIHLLHQDEGAQQTIILVGVEKKYVTISLFKIGKQVGSKTFERGEKIALDIEKGLNAFADVEVLPSRILLYGTVSDLEQIRADLLSYPWQQKANFLHFPKIDIVAPEYPVRAVAVASATELTPHTQEIAAPIATEKSILADAPTPPSVPLPDGEAPAVDTSDEISHVAQDLGFVSEKETAEPETAVSVPEETALMSTDDSPDEMENVVVPPPVSPAARLQVPKVSLPRISLPKVQMNFRLPTGSTLSLLLAGAVILGIVGASVGAATWFLPSATVTVLVQPKHFDKTEEITLDTKASNSDADGKVLAASMASTEVNASETVPTTGKKTVGEKATGEVTIFNKTLNSKTFKKGTKLAAGKLAFTLDADVNIASASEGLGSLTYGSSKGMATAEAIGTASNVAAGTDFSFSELPTTSYTARNDKALSGGSSREISVVSREDQKLAREKAVETAEKKAQETIKSQITGNQKLLEQSLKSQVTKETFSKEVGQEAKEVSAEVLVSIEAATYNESDFDSLLDKIITANISSDYAYTKENNSVKVEDITDGKDGVWKFKPHIQLDLLPKVETQAFAKNIVGKSVSAATEYLKSQPGVAGLSFDVKSPLPFFQNKLPLNAKKITIQTASL